MNPLTLEPTWIGWTLGALIATSAAVAGLVVVVLIAARVSRSPSARSAIWTATLLWVLASPVAWYVLASPAEAQRGSPQSVDNEG